MEQIQIRQPKMPAAQSFIQNVGTFLAIKFNLKAAHLTRKKITSLTRKQLKGLVSLEKYLKDSSSFIEEKTSQRIKFKNFSYLLFFINFQIYFLLIT